MEKIYTRPNISQDINKNLYIRYPGQDWTLFVESLETIHQKNALEQFIISGTDILDVNISMNGWTFVATFKKIKNIVNPKYSDLYYYVRPDKKTVQFVYF